MWTLTPNIIEVVQITITLNKDNNIIYEDIIIMNMYVLIVQWLSISMAGSRDQLYAVAWVDLMMKAMLG